MIKDKVKKALELCRDGKCNECLYNGWIREVCQKVLMDDALKVIDKLDKQKTKIVEQYTMNI